MLLIGIIGSPVLADYDSWAGNLAPNGSGTEDLDDLDKVDDTDEDDGDDIDDEDEMAGGPPTKGNMRGLG